MLRLKHNLIKIFLRNLSKNLVKLFEKTKTIQWIKEILPHAQWFKEIGPALSVALRSPNCLLNQMVQDQFIAAIVTEQCELIDRQDADFKLKNFYISSI